ncbi:NIMA (never in mitosis gene a)-related expressed kinase 2, isoform CRA_b, partial [Mus musculus]
RVSARLACSGRAWAPSGAVVWLPGWPLAMPSRVEDYEVLHSIGTGSYGRCQKIRRKSDGKILVWKELDYGSMTEVEKQMLVSEVNLLRELKHPNIVRYYDRIIDRTNTTLYIVMEYCEGGDLASVISKGTKDRQYLEEEFVLRVMTQLTLALKECHRRSDGGHTVLHRDLKPANVFLDSKHNVKLGDFGLARILNHDTSFAKTFVGTPYYMSPEQMSCLSYNEKSDIWSLGCLLYELCALMPPFTAFNQKELAGKIREGRFRRIPYRYSDGLNDLITRIHTVSLGLPSTFSGRNSGEPFDSRHGCRRAKEKSGEERTALRRAFEAAGLQPCAERAQVEGKATAGSRASTQSSGGHSGAEGT